MNLMYSFNKNKTYCVDTLFYFFSTTPVSPISTMNMVLNTVKVTGSYNTGDPVPAVPPSGVTIMNAPMNSLALNTYYYIPQTFTATDNFIYLWYYPWSKSNDVVTMKITQVNICEIDPCKQIKVYFRPYKKNCSFYFYPYIYGLTAGTTIAGYIWDFGDGTTSNDPYPNHFYSFGGGYTVTLTVYIKTKEGCCIKKFSIEMKVKNCDPCEILLEFWWVKRTLIGSSMKYEPTFPDNPYYIYSWTFSDMTTYNTREVWKTNYIGLSGSLTVFYAGNEEQCCEKTVRFGRRI